MKFNEKWFMFVEKTKIFFRNIKTMFNLRKEWLSDFKWIMKWIFKYWWNLYSIDALDMSKKNKKLRTKFPHVGMHSLMVYTDTLSLESLKNTMNKAKEVIKRLKNHDLPLEVSYCSVKDGNWDNAISHWEQELLFLKWIEAMYKNELRIIEENKCK